MFRYLSVNETFVNVLLSKNALNLFYVDISMLYALSSPMRSVKKVIFLSRTCEGKKHDRKICNVRTMIFRIKGFSGFLLDLTDS